MDHPQHYQPLSHALNPPPSSYPTTSSFQYEENEDEEDDVQQQLQESPHLVDHRYVLLVFEMTSLWGLMI